MTSRPAPSAAVEHALRARLRPPPARPRCPRTAARAARRRRAGASRGCAPRSARSAPSSLQRRAAWRDAIQAPELERRPVVLGAAERDEHRVRRARASTGCPLAGDEHRDVALAPRCSTVPDVAARHALAEQRPAPVDAAAGRPSRSPPAGRGPRPGRPSVKATLARGDPLPPTSSSRAIVTSSAASRSSLFSVCSAAAHRRRTRRAHQPRQDQLARRLRAGQRLGERQQLRERRLALRGDEDRALRHGQVGELRARPLARPPRAPPRPARRSCSSGRAA